MVLTGALLAQSGGDDKGGSSGGSGSGGSGSGSGSGSGKSGDDSSSGSSGFKFYGTIQGALPGNLIGTWTVGGRTVLVTSSTTLDQSRGSFGVGACVEVEGALDGNSIRASDIHRESSDKCGSGQSASELKFYGSVQRMPAQGLTGTWTVAGKSVIVTASTEIRQDRGPIAIGSCVEVEGPSAADGSITAVKLKAESGSSGCSASGSSGSGSSSSSNFYGFIQGMPSGTNVGDWMVSGRTVHFTTSTAFQAEAGRPAVVGACVEVEGAVERDGSITASKIKTDDSCRANARLSDTLKFYGLLQSAPSGSTWQVGGKTVRVSASTELEREWGPFAANACVSVRGQLQSDGSIAASHIETEPASDCGASSGGSSSSSGLFEMYGVIESWPGPRLPGDWTISGKTVRVASTTRLDFEHGAMSPGSCVEVHGNLLPSGIIEASKVEVVSGSGTCVFRGGVTNAASYSDLHIAPGMIVSVFGVNLGPARSMPFQIVDDKFIRNLGNVRVLFDGEAAPLVFVSPGQINAVVPYSVAGKSQVMVQVEHNFAWSNPSFVQVVPAAPAIFSQSMSGKGPGAILNVDDRGGRGVNGANNPARRGSFVEIYGTGEGRTTAPDDGRVAPAGCTARPLLPVRVILGEREIEAEYAGCAPGLVNGVFQVNARIPDDAPVGPNVPIYLKVGESRSRDGVTVAIRER